MRRGRRRHHPTEPIRLGFIVVSAATDEILGTVRAHSTEDAIVTATAAYGQRVRVL